MTPDTEVPWREIADQIARFVRRRVGAPDVVDDIVQDVLAKGIAGLREGRIDGSLHAWLLRVAHNAVVDHYRRRGRSSATVDAEVQAPPVDSAAERAGLLASFRAFVQALPPEQREAVLRTEYDGLSQAELARELGVPSSTVKSRVQRGRQRLEAALLDCCTFEFDRRGHLVDWHRRPGGACRDC
ncbi:MAG: sigma-70 family RNA polymerase sigma factor [Planctomycetes bacterium]|nr:sigma-70 family RNA polymerase sigma factor [Planctomycetota bacterium]